jgi:hypothetical protein
MFLVEFFKINKEEKYAMHYYRNSIGKQKPLA